MIGQCIPKDWDVTPVDKSSIVDDCKKRKQDKRLGQDNFQNRMELFISAIEEGDGLVKYSSPQKSWDELMGTEGLAIIRRGVVIAYITTKMN